MNLETFLDKIFYLNLNQKKGLEKLKIFNIKDLLYYFPIRYNDTTKLSYIKNIKKGDTVNIYAKVKSIQITKTRKNIAMTEAILEESSGSKIKAI
ncbi:MAG: hypothetical protein LRZ98_02265 [Candidatus Pacebacteria bacterium]|nr:hypothetical protein [Candidatus Paceibacterota bacterium]